jgi:hypothetical protein
MKAFAEELSLIKEAALPSTMLSAGVQPISRGARGLVSRVFSRGAAADPAAKATGLARLKQLWTGSRGQALKGQVRVQSPGAYQAAATAHGIPESAVRAQHLTGAQGQALRTLGRESARESALVGGVQRAKQVGKAALPVAGGAAAMYGASKLRGQ